MEHSGHEGQHVCHRCGWPFPNPHPSAKHRRAHRKHCGRIEGYVLAGAAAEKARASDEEHSDEGHHAETEAAVEASKGEEGKGTGSLERGGEDGTGGSGEVVEEGGLGGDPAPETKAAVEEVVEAWKGEEGKESGSLEMSGEGEHGADAVEGIVGGSGEIVEGGNLDEDAALGPKDADETLKTCDLPHDNQVRDCHMAIVADQLERGMKLEDTKVLHNTVVDSYSNDKEGSAHPVLKEESSADRFEEKTDTISALDCPAIVDCTDKGAYMENDINVSSLIAPTELIPHASDSSVVELGLSKMDECAEIDFPSSHASDRATVTNCLSDELSAGMSEVNMKSFHPEDKQENAGHVSENKLFKHVGSCFIEVSEHLAASNGFLQLQHPHDMAGDHKVEGNEQNKNASSSLISVETSEMKHGDCEPNESLAFADSEARKEPEHHPEYEEPNVIYSEWEPVCPNVSSSDASPTMPLERNDCFHHDSGNRSSVNDFGCNDIVKNRDGSPYVNDLKNEAEFSLPYCEVVENLVSDGMKAHPHSATEGSSVNEAIALNRPVTSSCEMDVATTRSEPVETKCPLEGQETCKNLGHEHMSVNDMVTTDVGDVALPEVAEAIEPNKLAEGSQLSVHEEAWVHYSSVVEGHIPDTCKGDCSMSDSNVNAEAAGDAPEMKPPYDETGEEHALGRDQDLNTCTSLGYFVESKDKDEYTGDLEMISGPHSDQIEHQLSLQEGFMKVAVDTNTGYSQTGKETENIGSESSAKECQEELDHQKVQHEQLENRFGFHLGKMNQKEDVNEKSADFEVGTDYDQGVSQSEIQIEHNETERHLPAHEERDLDLINEDAVAYRSAQHSIIEGPVTAQVELEPCLQRPMPTEEFKTSDTPEVVASGTCYQYLSEETNLPVSNQQPDAALVAPDASLDSNSQSDSVEGQWGSISEVTVPSTSHASDGLLILDTRNSPTTDTQTLGKLYASKTATETVAADENGVDGMNVFEAPSFMTLVEPGRKPSSNEIQPTQNLQHESHRRKKNEEIIAKVVNWSPGKPHTPLKNLLIEANFESKQKAGIAQDHHMSSPTKSGRVMQDEGRKPKAPEKMAPENSSNSFSRADQREWNSPARLPVRKNDKRVKGKPTWVPFICCPSMN